MYKHICFLVFCFYYNRITRYFNNQRKMYLISSVSLVDCVYVSEPHIVKLYRFIYIVPEDLQQQCKRQYKNVVKNPFCSFFNNFFSIYIIKTQISNQCGYVLPSKLSSRTLEPIFGRYLYQIFLVQFSYPIPPRSDFASVLFQFNNIIILFILNSFL